MHETNRVDAVGTKCVEAPARLAAPRVSRCLGWAMAAMLFTASCVPSARASTIFGTLSNFDIYNTTPEPCEGAEIELEGIHSSDISRDFPAHFANKTITEYNDSMGNFAGTRITYTGYNFAGAPTPGSLLPNANPTTTNGHALTYTAGGEHFGFSLGAAQPTAMRFFWLNDNAGTYERIGNTPQLVPSPTWSYQPPAVPGGAPVLRAEVRVPEPAEVIAQRPDSIWMKVYKTEIDRAVDLDELMSGPGIVPQDGVEIETEWELLEGGKMKMAEAEVGDNAEAVIRRYEFFKYTGPYDSAHEPTSDFLDTDLLVPPDGELGAFIAANMVAANLVEVPEPSTWVLLLTGLAVVGWRSRHARRAITVAFQSFLLSTTDGKAHAYSDDSHAGSCASFSVVGLRGHQSRGTSHLPGRRRLSGRCGRHEFEYRARRLRK